MDKQETMNIDKCSIEYTNILNRTHIKDFEQYELDRLLFVSVCDSYNLNTWKVIKSVIKSILLKNLRGSMIKTGNSGLLMYTNYCGRKDHDGYWNNFKNMFSDYSEYLITDSKKIDSIINYFTKTKILFYYLHALKEISTFKNRLYLSSRLLNLLILKKQLEKSNVNQHKVFVTFFDGGYKENIAVQYAKLTGLKTVTLQHSQPIFKGFDYDRLNQSVIINFTSDFGICASEFSKLQYEKAGFLKDKLPILGSLKEKQKLDIVYSFKPVFCVFLDTPGYFYYKSTNKELLKHAISLAEIMGYKFYIKPHPNDNDNYENYLNHRLCLGLVDKMETISDMDGIGFGLTHTSGIFVDMLFWGIKPYKMKSIYPFNITENALDVFDGIDELNDKVAEWSKFSDNERKSYFERSYNFYSTSNSVKKHKEFIEGLLNNE